MARPSLTFWNRLEPRTRTSHPFREGLETVDYMRSLQVQVHDPMWFLSRQWMFGEFRGEDAGSPAYVQLRAQFAPIDRWAPKGGRDTNVDGTVPLEALVESEPFTPDLATAVELGQAFAARLVDAGLEALVEPFRAAYPLPTLPQEVLAAKLFETDALAAEALDTAVVTPELTGAFSAHGIDVGQSTEVHVQRVGERWVVQDHNHGKLYAVRAPSQGAQLGEQLASSEPFSVYSAAVPDDDAARFLRVCAPRSMDGIALYAAAQRALPELPAVPAIADAGVRKRVLGVIASFYAWVDATFGAGFANEDPLAWQADRLEYDIEASAVAADGRTVRLQAQPGRSGQFEWYSFDEVPSDVELAKSRARRVARSLLPINLQFRGMPHARLWQFEDAASNIEAIQPDVTELVKLSVMDFIMVTGNDWYVVPFAQDLGSLCWIESLVVHDVFGGDTVVDRADRNEQASGATRAWSMFSTSIRGSDGEFADYFILPPSVGNAAQVGEAIEETRFMRDEMANMVWGIEQVTENEVGAPWPGHERSLAGAPDETPPTAAAPLTYRLQTRVPEHWIPFVAVQVDADSAEVALERAAMLRPVEGEQPEPVRPRGRILNPSLGRGAAYRVREEEVPRTGVRVMRRMHRSRWVDGSTHLWVARSKQVGSGEGHSGLRFDVAVPTERGKSD